jgi:dihydrofolate synthase/folylpolyglutamate synthase
VFEGEPLFVLDGAHNQAGAEALKKAVKDCFPDEKILMVTGMLKDKDIDTILENFCEITDTFIAAEPDNPRKLPAAELAEKLKGKGATVKVAEDAEAALKMAAEHEMNPRVILCAGSLYLISALRGNLI